MKKYSEIMWQTRLERGWTQTEAASLLGIDEDTYCRYESGEEEPPATIMIKLSSLLEITPSQYVL